MPSESQAVRLYRGLLWLYPLEFREYFTEEVCLLLADSLRAQPNGLRRLGVWLSAVAGILCDAPREHCHMIHQDVIYALRTMSRDKVTSLIAILVLALGIGSTATVFTLVNGILLHPLPFPEQDRLIYVEENNGKAGGIAGAVAFPNYLDFANRNRTLDSFALYTTGTATLRREGVDAEKIPMVSATGALFRVLGVAPIRGRTFNEQDDQPKAAPVMVLSEDLWRNRFGGDPGIVGQKILLGAESLEVIGVMPRSFRFPDNSQMWVPAQMDVKQNRRTDHGYQGIARLRAGVTPAQAQTDLRVIMQQILREHPDETYNQTVNAMPFQQQVTRDVKPILLALLGAVGFVLLIACANTAGLLLVRASARQREVAVRGALGASRSRLVRQFVVESSLLAFLAAVVGVAIALPAIPRLLPHDTLPVWASFAAGLRTLVFVVLVTTVTAVVVGALPALAASRLNLVEMLKEGGRSSSDGLTGSRVRSGLVIAEVAMSVLLLSGAGLMIRTFLNLEHQQMGYRVDNITTLQTTAPRDRYPSGPQAEQLMHRTMAEFASIPGVVSVAASSGVPIADGWGRSLTVETAPLLSLRDAPLIQHTVVTPGYFKTLGIPILEGRDFNGHDTDDPKVTIVDAAIAKHYWPNQSAIGKRVRYGPPESNGPWHTVVGVVGEVRNQDVRTVVNNSVYLPYGEYSYSFLSWLVRTNPSMSSPGEALRRRVSQIDRNIAVSRVVTLRQIVDDSLWQERFFASLLAFFAGLAMVMATVGLYGVMAFTVSRRTHELGIRMALGASAREIRRMVLWQSGRLVGAGLFIGVLAALFLTRLIEKQLYGVQASDPRTFLTVCAILTAAALLASYVPSRRATRVDPMLALRSE
jgi:putative ABC transport system permease protein